MPRVNNFKNGLIEAIKVSGEMLIENAEDIAGKTSHMSMLTVTIEFDPENASIPEMTITRSHWPNSEKLDRLYNAFYTEEATDDDD